MDVIISANEKILHMIKEISVDENGNVDVERLTALAFKTTDREDENNGKKEI